MTPERTEQHWMDLCLKAVCDAALHPPRRDDLLRVKEYPGLDNVGASQINIEGEEVDKIYER